MKYNFDNINSKQYFRLLKVGETKKPEEIIWALTGKDKNELTLDEIDKFKIGELKPHGDPTTARMFMADGTLYGMQDIDEISFGLFQDVMELGSDLKDTLPTIMSYMYRPVTKISSWNLIKLRIISKMGKRLRDPRMARWITKMLFNIKYETEKYNPLKCERRMEQVLLAPSTTGHHLVTFFLILSKELQLHSLSSLKEKIQVMKKSLKLVTT